MFIEKIQIQNFGPIKYQRFPCSVDKLNVILGDNGVGKTQFLAAIYAIFFDEEILHHFYSSEITGSVLLQIVSDQKRITLIHQHNNVSSNLLFDSYDRLKDAAEIDRNKLYFYVFDSDMSRNRRYTVEDIIAAQQFLHRIGLREHHILGTCLAKKELNVYMTVSEYRYLDAVCLLSKIPEGSVLFIDGLFASIEDIICSMLLDVLLKLDGIQIFIAEYNRFEDLCTDRKVNLLHLSPPTDERSPVSYNYEAMMLNHSIPSDVQIGGESAITPIFYREGQAVPEGESSVVEFKEIKGARPCESIVANAEIYINAYLNSFGGGVGRIYWGISDRRIVIGVTLTYEDRDNIQRRISELLSQAGPFVSPDRYKIEFYPIEDKMGKIKPDTYVVEVSVKLHPSRHLYSTSKGEVYIKTPGGKKKLSALQIQEQVLMRSADHHKRERSY